MQRTGLAIWFGMLTIAAAMALGYLWFTAFPGVTNSGVFTYFTPAQIEQGRTYSQALRVVFITGTAAQCAFLAWLIFSGRAELLSRLIIKTTSGSTTLGALSFFIVLWLLLEFISLPFAYFSGFSWQHKWGFSTQTAGSWFIDYLKSAGVELFLSVIGAMLLFFAIKRLAKLWWLAAAIFLSVWIVVASYLWPVLVSPIFNQFTPPADQNISVMVKRLADKAGLPVNEVLVMDASRRTNRSNAYFAGVGDTRRVVLYDTLLRDYRFDEVESVVAHEIAHWHQGHIVQGMLWGVVGAVLGWGLLYLLLRLSVANIAVPYVWAFILLFFHLGSFITLPAQNAISRQMEREADAVAVSLTGNPQAAVRLQISLAVKNNSDPAPAAYLRLFSSHPPAIERIQSISKP